MPAPPTRHGISVVLPAFNEQDNIATAVMAATTVGTTLFADHEVIVVDDGSSDRTAELVRTMARADPAIVLVQHDRNRGYGEALRSGFRAATKDLIFFTDADNQFDMWELERFVPWIDTASVVAGYRVNREDTFVRRLNARGWNLLVRSLFCVPVRDIDCAFKLFRREVFDVIDLESVGAMVNTELMVKVGRSGVGIVEIGVRHLPRRAGVARGAHPRVIARALREVVSLYRQLHDAGVEDTPGIYTTPPERRRRTALR
ncbi:MAG TPA: glycosyltransferase family 2 protein [Mycobacteriales bacterium]|nr:glycosyltransferase family 2 protein [Mycobacteriales bacterium]